VGGRRKAMRFYKVLKKCKTIRSLIFPFPFSLEHRISETNSLLQMSRGLVLLDSSVASTVTSKHSIFGSRNQSARGLGVFNRYHNMRALFMCISAVLTDGDWIPG